MSISPQRLTLFAIINSIESDLRSVIRTLLLPNLNIANLLSSEELDKTRDRFERDESFDAGEETGNEALIEHLDFGEELQIINRHRALLPKDIAKYFRSKTSYLNKLVPVRHRVMHGRPLHFDDFPLVCDIAKTLSTETYFTWDNLVATLSEIEQDHSYIFKLNYNITDQRDSHIFHNLPLPDFDDTGFFGRNKICAKLKKEIMGAFPVISIVGTGGIGKTAIALKIAHDLLDESDLPFDGLVWVSAKSARLTGREITRIEGAIHSSIGIFEKIIDVFGEINADEAQDRVMFLLENYKILLIIDNLETVLDNKLREFITRVPRGSKILLTSRVAVGSGDLKVDVPTFSAQEGRAYLRKLIDAYDVTRLRRAKPSEIDRYIKRLALNPLFLKWFVTAVKAGSRPEEIIADPKIALEFCLDNVFSFLDANAKTLCGAFLAIPSRHSQTVLAYLTNFDPTVLQSALILLLDCNIVRMVSADEGKHTAYELDPLARAYLRRVHPLAPSQAEDFNHRYSQVSAAVEETERLSSQGKFMPHILSVRNKEEAVIARELRQALFYIKQGRYREAWEILDKAYQWCPTYFEIKRIQAFYFFKTGEIYAAKEAYETALEEEPGHAPLWYWYGGFLLRAFNNIPGALEALKKSLNLDPSHFIVKREIARCHLFGGDYEEARKIIEELGSTEGIGEKDRRIIYDLHIQYFHRSFENYLSLMEYVKALGVLGKAHLFIKTIPDYYLDDRILQKLRKVAAGAVTICKIFHGSDKEKEAKYLSDWFADYGDYVLEGADSITDSDLVIGSSGSGKVVRIAANDRFGFLLTDSGRELFFHKSQLDRPEALQTLLPGTPVKFTVGRNEKGLTATNVKFLFDERVDQT